MRYVFACLFWFSSLLATVTDAIDYVMVGSSPVMLLEAIYRSFEGYKVVVVEQASEIGGAWKTVTVCGVPHVDLGCHELGKDFAVRQFLEEYVGCPMVENAPSCFQESPWGFYPQGGCHTLLSKLHSLLLKAGGELWLNAKVESVKIEGDQAEILIGNSSYIAKHLVITRHSEINLEGQSNPASCQRYIYPHLYLLIADALPSQFTYSPTPLKGASRLMNVTPFTELAGTGYQLIVVQLRKEHPSLTGRDFVEEMKEKGLIGKEAVLIQEEKCIYEQGVLMHELAKARKPLFPGFEILETNHINQIAHYLERWKMVIPRQ